MAHETVTSPFALVHTKGSVPVRAKGQDLQIVPAGTSNWRGYWVGIRIDPLTGNLQGGTTRFFNRRALEY